MHKFDLDLKNISKIEGRASQGRFACRFSLVAGRYVCKFGGEDA